MNREIVTKRDVDHYQNHAEQEINRLKQLLKKEEDRVHGEIKRVAYEKGRQAGLIEALEWLEGNFERNAVEHGEFVHWMKSEGTFVSDFETLRYKWAAKETNFWLRVMKQKLEALSG